MTDHEQTPPAPAPTRRSATPPGRAPSDRGPQLETILTLDEVMNSARLVERTARICLRGDLEATYLEALEELSELVDEDGQVASDGDQALADSTRATELLETVRSIRAEMATATRRIMFRAMPEDEWTTFDKPREDAVNAGKGRGVRLRGLQQPAHRPLRDRTDHDRRPGQGHARQDSPPPRSRAGDKAWSACTTGGLDIPKSLSFSPAQKPQGPATS